MITPSSRLPISPKSLKCLIFKIMDFKEIIKDHLDMMAEQDAAFAERYKDEKKSLDKCIQYITSEAKKQAVKGCAAIEDAVVYGWAVHYYQEDNLDIDNVKAKVVVPEKKKEDKPKKVEKPKEIRPIKALQLDLFGGF